MAIFGWTYTSTIVIVTIVLFFILAVINRFANFIMPYNRWISWTAGLLPFVAIAYFWAIKPALVIGLLGGVAGGIIGGIFFGGTESD